MASTNSSVVGFWSLGTWVSMRPKASQMASPAMMREAPSSAGSRGRKESDRYSKKASTSAFLPRALARAAALTSASDWPEPEEPPWLFMAGRLLISSYTLCTAPPMTIW